MRLYNNTNKNIGWRRSAWRKRSNRHKTSEPKKKKNVQQNGIWNTEYRQNRKQSKCAIWYGIYICLVIFISSLKIISVLRLVLLFSFFFLSFPLTFLLCISFAVYPFLLIRLAPSSHLLCACFSCIWIWA